MNNSRIPAFEDKTVEGMAAWFNGMSERGLLFHPDDSASDIFTIATGKPMFSSFESRQIDIIMNEMFQKFGGKVHDAAYPVFMRSMGIAP